MKGRSSLPQPEKFKAECPSTTKLVEATESRYAERFRARRRLFNGVMLTARSGDISVIVERWLKGGGVAQAKSNNPILYFGRLKDPGRPENSAAVLLFPGYPVVFREIVVRAMWNFAPLHHSGNLRLMLRGCLSNPTDCSSFFRLLEVFSVTAPRGPRCRRRDRNPFLVSRDLVEREPLMRYQSHTAPARSNSKTPYKI